MERVYVLGFSQAVSIQASRFRIYGGVASAASGCNFIRIFKAERMKGDNDTHVIKERKGSKEFTDLFC